jgi:signal transduction histidine kinase
MTMADKFGAGLSLLIVEDDARTLSELERILLRHSDLEILAAPTPPRAIELAAAKPPDLALLDIRLPGMDGLTLLDRLREDNRDLLAIVMTGFREEQTARESRDRGAVDFLEKPLDLPYLLAVLRQQSRETLLRREVKAALTRLQRVLDRSGDGFALEGSQGALLASNPLGLELFRNPERCEEGHTRWDGRVFQTLQTREGGEVLHHWRDVTDALEAERGRAYRHMARLLAHELMNPLTPMRLWLQDIEAQQEGDPEFEPFCRKGVSVVLSQVDRLSTLVARFRALGNEAPLEARPVDVVRQARSTVEALAPLARDLCVSVGVEAPPSLSALADGPSLDQVLFNLTRNAVEAQAGRKGAVLLEVLESNGGVEVRISDRAGGFPAGAEASLFTPYLTTKPGGTGLGLLICRELLARMGSALAVENRPGEGVTFSFRLPVAGGGE